MNFWETVQKRRSVRHFDSEREVPPQMVERILEAAITAPTAGDRQPWHFVVVKDAKVRKAIAQSALRQDFVAQAPVVIVVCGEPERSGARRGQRLADLYTVQDTAAATENILLAATALGLGSCWVSEFREEALAEALGLSERFWPLAVIPIGYPLKEAAGGRRRRPLEEVVRFIG